MSDRDERKTAEERAGAGRPRDEQDDNDKVDRESDNSFPASDAPSWSGSTALRNGVKDEEPPKGSQAGWSAREWPGGDPLSGKPDESPGLGDPEHDLGEAASDERSA